MSDKTLSQQFLTRFSVRLAAASGAGVLLLAALLLVISADSPALAAPFAGIDPPTGADWAVNGEATFSYYGFAVTEVGDVDDDGYDDVVIGSHSKHRTDAFQPDPTDSQVGRIYLYRGGAGGLDTAAAFTLTGEAGGDWFGYSVSAAGDINGDNVADFIASAPQADTSGGVTDTGKVYVFLGRQAGTPVLDKVLAGEAAGDLFGHDASGAGDVNKDGYDDIIVGAWRHARNGTEQDTGKVYVYYGTSSGISAAPAFTVDGEYALDGFGVAVSGAGDVNSDGYDDVIVGAWQNDEGGSDAGKVYVYHGSDAGLSQTPSFTANGEAQRSEFGAAVDAAGDVNGDGYDDVVVGAYRNDEAGEDAGKAYIFLGSAAGLVKPAIAIDVGERADDRYGFSVDGAGDVNGDGFDDVIVGAHQFDKDVANNVEDGKVYVYGGCLNGLQEAPIFASTGDNGRYGRAVSTAGDVNKDGFDDLLVGAYTLVGKAYAYHGAVTGACYAQIEMAQSIGLPGIGDPCGSTTDLVVPKGATVAFCYHVKNTGSVPLAWHSLVDTKLGGLLVREPVALLPGETYAHVISTTAESDMTNQSVWTAGSPINAPGGAPSNPPGKEITATSAASATVTVRIALETDDTDGDGITDNVEGVCDKDDDGIPAHLDPDEVGCASVQLTQGVAIVGFMPTCATQSTMQVPRDTNMEYCYTVTNTGNITLTQHELTSNGFGSVLSAMTMELIPGASHTYSTTEQIHVTTVNAATWTARSVLPALTAASVATSTVIISTDTDDLDDDGILDNLEKVTDEDGDDIPAFLDPDDGGDGANGGLFFPLIARP